MPENRELAEKIRTETEFPADVIAQVQKWPPGSRHSIDTKIKFVAHYCSHGSIKAACKHAKIAHDTGTNWLRHAPWYHAIAGPFREALDRELDAKLSKIISLGVNAQIERLEKGDVKVLRDGEIVLVPVNAKDSALLTSVAMDKRNVIRTKTVKKQEVGSMLNDLAGMLKQKLEENQKVIDGEIVSESDIQGKGDKNQ